ncbi:MAG: hypothetical protein RMM28_11820, partial [Thermoleophilia bacterium]|nr:hypothetical protein [Thermoleophilia bacterium]
MSEALLEALLKEREKQQIREEAEALSRSYLDFVRAAWPTIKPDEQFMSNWHLYAVAAHLEAVSRGEITRLQVWVPPGSMKSLLVTVFWHPWEWTTRPGLRYWTASYETRLCGRFSALARSVMMHPWYQERWGHMFSFTREAEHYYENDRGGSRLATSPTTTGTGEHGHRIIIDDPVSARAADPSVTGGLDFKAMLQIANEWYASTVVSRGIDSEAYGKHARILVMQRLHENDLAANLLEIEEWTVLCLPERYEPAHPYAWRKERVHPAVRLPPELRDGDPRVEGELLWPARRDEAESDAMARHLRYRAAGQLQQRPAVREGEILKRDWWRFYDPRIRAKEEWHRLPDFSLVVVSVDTPLKDKESNDLVAIQCWGVKGADRYLLDLRKGHMNYSACKRQVREMTQWARRIWRQAAHYVLIENAGYGVELILDLKREVSGVLKVTPTQEGDKVMRAEAASADIESGNVFLPGHGPPWQPALDEARCPAEIADFIASCAVFPNGT